MTSTELTTHSGPSTDRRRSVRLFAAALCALLAALYLALTVLVRDAELTGGYLVDSTWGGYLFLAVPYVVGAVLLVVADRRLLFVVGAVVQVLVLVAFLVFAVGVLLGPENEGVFVYEALDDLPMEAFAAVTTALEVVLLALLVRLALPHDAATSAPA